MSTTASTPPSSANHTAQIHITGSLVERAQCRVTTTGGAMVLLLVGQGSHKPLLAQWRFGHGPAAQRAAANAAHSLCTGTQVQVYGSGLRQGLFSGRAVLLLDHVDTIIRPHINHTEAA